MMTLKNRLPKDSHDNVRELKETIFDLIESYSEFIKVIEKMNPNHGFRAEIRDLSKELEDLRKAVAKKHGY